MKLILIDTENQTVKHVESKGTLEELQRMVGGYIEPIPFGPRDHSIYVDEEGLLKLDNRGFFAFNETGPYKGNAVVVGLDSEGDTVEPVLTVEDIEKRVRFL